MCLTEDLKYFKVCLPGRTDKMSVVVNFEKDLNKLLSLAAGYLYNPMFNCDRVSDNTLTFIALL